MLGALRLEVPGSLCPFWGTRLGSDSSRGPFAGHGMSTGNGFRTRSRACWGGGGGAEPHGQPSRPGLRQPSLLAADPSGHPAWCHPSAGRARGVAPPNSGPPFRSSLSLVAGKDEGGCGGSGCRRGSPQAQVLGSGQGRHGAASWASGHLDRVAQTFMILQALAPSWAQGAGTAAGGADKQVCLSPGPSSVSVVSVMGLTRAANQANAGVGGGVGGGDSPPNAADWSFPRLQSHLLVLQHFETFSKDPSWE